MVNLWYMHLTIVMDFRGTITDLRQRLSLPEPQDLRPDGETARLISPLYIAANSLNSHIVTVSAINDGRLKLLQQLWDATTCKVIWKHEQLHLAQWKTYPTFAHDGLYAGFYDEDRIHVVHVESKEKGFVLLIFSKEPTVSVIPKARPIIAFAISNETRCLALVRRNNQKRYGLQERVLGERSIDWVNVTDDQTSPQLAYSSDANTLFVGYQVRKSRGFFSTNVPTLIVDCFNVLDRSKRSTFETKEAIESYQFRRQMVELYNMECVVVDVTYRHEDQYYGSKRVVLAIAGDGSVQNGLGWLRARTAGYVREVLVSRRMLLAVFEDGSVRDPKGYPQDVLFMEFQRSSYPNCTVLAVDARNGDWEGSGRVTILTEEGQMRTSMVEKPMTAEERVLRMFEEAQM
jgi:hypothetical protein